MSSWRLLFDAAAPGPWNMGVDEALLASAAAGGSVALRFYQWQGPWLSLGYAQRPGAAELEALSRAGVRVVRRATGGRAVLHGADLTYSVAAPIECFPQGLRATYARIADALAWSTRALGIEAQRVAKRRPGVGGSHFDCFAAPAHDELCAGGRKLIGSAQRRVGGAVLQHGSIRLGPDPGGAALAAGLSPEVATSLREQGCALDAGAVAEVFVAGFARVFEIEFTASELSAEERSRAARRGLDPPTALARSPRSALGLPQGGCPATDQ
jgi:lipoate-protein ligase A